MYSDLVGYQTSDIRLLWTITPNPPPPPPPNTLSHPPPPPCQRTSANAQPTTTWCGTELVYAAVQQAKH